MATKGINNIDQLNDRQRAFVDAYLVDPNATKAAEAAGYSKRTAQEQGSRLLSNAIVAAEIKRRQAQRADRAKLTAHEVLREIDTLASSDIGQVFDLDAEALRMLPMREWPAEARKAVASVKVKVYPLEKPNIDDETLEDLQKLADSLTSPLLRRVTQALIEARWDQYQIIELKLWDKNSALDKAGKHRGLWGEKGVTPEAIRDLLAKQIDAILAALPPADAEKVITAIRPVWLAA